MLQTLKVKNLAIVENVRVDFEHGLNVITGETGAGKSIIIGALGILLGGRAGKTLIRADNSDGEVVVQHFIERFPGSRFAPCPICTVCQNRRVEPWELRENQTQVPSP